MSVHSKAVASPNFPLTHAILPLIPSNNCPKVIREGIACGLTIISGITPDEVNGISDCSTINPRTPFCPWREENLSPNSGILKSLTFIFTSLFPSTVSEIITVSTIPFSLCLIFFEVSRRLGCINSNSS
ncbi:hypothetical protein ES705_45514 [subsurface metagenome]